MRMTTRTKIYREGSEAKEIKTTARVDRMRELREQGHSLQAIGHEFGLSRQRVHQLLVKHIGTSQIPMPSGDEVAKLLGINWYHLKHWERQGLLNPIHYNGEYRCYYPRSEIEKARELFVTRQRRCVICNTPIPMRRVKYCDKCVPEQKKLTARIYAREYYRSRSARGI